MSKEERDQESLEEALQLAHEKFCDWATGVGMDEASAETIWRIGWNDPFYNYDSVRHLHVSDDFGANPGKDGFVVVGCCLNGDQIAIDVRDTIGSVWYVSHESMHRTPLREIAICIANSLQEMYDTMYEVEDFPFDFYSAKAKLQS